MESNRHNGCVVSKQGIDSDLKALKIYHWIKCCVSIFHFCNRSVIEEAQKTTMAAAIHETSSSAHKRWLPLEANPDVMNQVLSFCSILASCFELLLVERESGVWELMKSLVFYLAWEVFFNGL